ncbi:MAG: hypothetical protein JW700_00800 [Candidatus Aenigmarchaeota archaeon]|nr:hypothetical protein [Candidatus Aenigmarchaeota archaeon]
MILILSTCQHRLSELEFVEPMKAILRNKGIEFDSRQYSQKFKPEKYDRIIICGTALQDFDYMDDVEEFKWIEEYSGKLLGICSGAQIIASIFGEVLEEKTVIGKGKVIIEKENALSSGEFDSYFLLSKVPIIKNLKKLDREGFVFKKEDREIYGVLFHPEVLNKEIIENFCKN